MSRVVYILGTTMAKDYISKVTGHHWQVLGAAANRINGINPKDNLYFSHTVMISDLEIIRRVSIRSLYLPAILYFRASTFNSALS